MACKVGRPDLIGLKKFHDMEDLAHLLQIATQ